MCEINLILIWSENCVIFSGTGETKFKIMDTKQEVLTWSNQDNTKLLQQAQGDHYRTGCLLDYNYFNEHYKMIAIDYSKQQALNPDLKVRQQINFTGNLIHKNNDDQDINDSTIMFFIIEEVKETILEFSHGTVKVL